MTYRLPAVQALRYGHPGVRNTAKVPPVPLADLEATLAVLTPGLAAMVKLQHLTGMRSGNPCAMRTADVDSSGGADGTGAWVYRPRTHKTAHHGHELAVRLGPQAREVLTPYLKPEKPEAFIFSPAEEIADVRAARAAARVTPPSCGNRRGSKPAKRSPRGQARDHYTPNTYAQRIARACDVADANAREAKARAGVEVPADQRLVGHWHPHQLRHNRGGVVRAKHGVDGVLAALGQKTASMADRYAEIEAGVAEKVAAEVG